MDGYAKSMLYDDMGSNEKARVQCPGCGQVIEFKVSDQVIRCKRCGETFYIEELEDYSEPY